MSAAGATFGQRVWAKMPSVHIVAPICKWMLVIAGLKDTQRPVEKLSGTQQIALMATGVIWTRWAGFVIKPRNPLLASVNFFLGAVAGYQVSRIAKWRLEEGDSAGQIAYYIFEGKPAEGCKPVVEPSAALESTIWKSQIQAKSYETLYSPTFGYGNFDQEPHSFKSHTSETE